MRALRVLFCAVAITACFAPGVRADEYTKQTFLTFSGPVQLPGITLAAGTYQFKLADPESGRQTLQVWDKDGTRLYATLLTIPDRRPNPSDKPTVMFAESSSGEAQPIRAWFYPNETYGQEFVYPKAQAMKIARETHSSVLAFNDDAKDASEYKTAKIGRLDENGQMNEAEKDASSTTTASTDTGSTGAAAAASAPAQTARAQSSPDTQPTMPAPSAHRSDASAPVGTSGVASTAPSAATTASEANRDNIPANRAVGTSGSANTAASANSAGQTEPGANRTLPRTAGSMTLVQLLAGLSIAAGVALRLIRTRANQV